MNDVPASTLWTVDVSVSNHDALKEGVTEVGWSRYRVAARDDVEARLVACQCVSRYGMPTDALVVDWPRAAWEPTVDT